MMSMAAVAALVAPCALAQEVPVLTVYAYDSFVSEWGPGPQVEAAFEADCACDLRLVGAGDGAALLARVQLEGASSEADVVLGLDTGLIAAAHATGLFAPRGWPVPQLQLPVGFEDEVFVPFDWGYFAFVYDKGRLADPPASFAALLADEDIRIIIQDPRSSTPGLGLLMWVKAVFGDDAAGAWAALAPKVVTVTAGWSEAYGLFLEGEADMVLSYTTSPAYHVIAEGDGSKAAAIFDEGHYVQLEVAGMLAGSDQPELAGRFLDFLLGAAVQGAIPTTNWMYPVRMPEGGLPEGYAGLAKPGKALLFGPAEAEALRRPALDEWLAAFAR
jgi:thiamine transport system substrate-binding protein